MRYVASGLESGDLMFNSRHHRRHRGGPMGGRKFRASANVKTFLSTLLLTELSILVVVFLLPFPLSVPFFFHFTTEHYVRESCRHLFGRLFIREC